MMLQYCTPTISVSVDTFHEGEGGLNAGYSRSSASPKDTTASRERDVRMFEVRDRYQMKVHFDKLLAF